MGSVSESTAEGRIVVGVDGSPSSRRALEWAIGQARATGAVVDAVACWVYPAMYGVVMAKPEPRLGEETGHTLARTVADVAGGDPPVEIRQTVLLGNAAEELLGRAAGADLLVLGRREHHAFVNVLAGSVSQYCVQHARCPVVVLRDFDH